MRRKASLSKSAKLAVCGALIMGVASLALAYPAQRLVGQMFEADGQLDDAVVYYKEWTKRYPADKEARWHLASLLLNNAKPDDAVAQLEAMYQDWPKDREILEKLVEIEDSLLRVDAVVPRLEELTRAHPDNVMLRQRLSDHYRWFGRQKELEESLKQMVFMGGDVAARTELVEILFSEERYEELIEIFEKSMHSFENPQHARFVLFDAYMRIEKIDKARENLNRLRSFDVGNVEYFELELDLLRTEGKFKEAKDVLFTELNRRKKENLKLGPLTDSLGSLAYELYEKDLVKDAIEVQKALVDLYPGDMDKRFILAEMHGPKRSDEVAVQELKRMLESQPRNVEVLMALGERLSWLGQYRETSKMYLRAIEVQPTETIRRKVVEHLTRIGDTEEALRQSRVLVKNNNPRDKVNFINLLASSGQQEEALTVAEDLVRQAPNAKHKKLLSKLKNNELGETGYDCGKRIKILTKTVEQDPDDVRAWNEIYDCSKIVGKDDLVQRAGKNIIRLQGKGALR